MTRSPIACPDPARWLEVAAGTGNPEISIGLTEHAAQCAACASQLREALRVMADEADAPEDAFVTALESSRPAWQNRMAQQLAAARAAEAPPVAVPARPTPWWNLRMAWGLAAVAMVLVAAVAIFLPRRAAAPAAVERLPALIPALVLEPITTRGLGDVVSLKMTQGTEWADITLQFVDAPPRQLSVQFLNAAEREVWRTELVLTDADARRGQVTVRLPAGKLSAGDYHISAGPVTDASGKHVSYAFRVTY
ncbi:MAG TPA: hypothetical protein VML19_13360 [Verrucomicrobiae bacterium]|nr:hypothetical protein [Verrucomicrobiae bacterium]